MMVSVLNNLSVRKSEIHSLVSFVLCSLHVLSSLLYRVGVNIILSACAPHLVGPSFPDLVPPSVEVTIKKICANI